SGHHARVIWDGREGGAVLEDLGSSNGTSIGQPDRKISRAPLNRGDTVFFGTHAVAASELLSKLTPMAGPIPVLAFPGRQLTVGREPGSDRVFDFPMVSGRHAQLARVGGKVLIEDLGSANGTYVNGRRIDRKAFLKSGDLVGLGSYTVEFQDLEAGTDAEA